jgi:zinc transport system ATP-binding protein
VLNGVGFDIRPGEIVAIMGPNGSGKSTLMRALLGIVPLTRGTVEIHGTPLRDFRNWARIGYVPQRLGVGGGGPATVWETVATGRTPRRRRWPFLRAYDREAVARALSDVDLTHRAGDAVQELSGGQQQRVLIARALAGEPDTFVLDEPMAGVDAQNQQALARSLGALSRQGHTVVVVVHELGPLAPLIERSIVLTHGRIIHDGPPPRPVGEHALPGHDHVHPHADTEPTDLALPAPEGLRLD